MNTTLKYALAVAGFAFATQAAAQITFYENEGFQGRSFSTGKAVGNFERYGFNDRANSVVVTRDRWEVCEDARFRGRCIVLRPGQYPSLAAMGLEDEISSVRGVGRNVRVDESRYAPIPVAERDYDQRDYDQRDRDQRDRERSADERRYAPAPVAEPDYRRRDNERLYEAQVTSVHAVVGPPEQRCWIEHEQVAQERSGANVPGAIAGAVIGGILGHQVGGGRGQDVATAGGAVAGAALGANIGREGQQRQVQEVQRCSTTPSDAQPDYWDVTYEFRGEPHRVQMSAPPGRTIAVNDQGEPRS